MSTARKLEVHDPNVTKARLSPGRQWIGIGNLEAPDELQPRAGIDKDWVSKLEAFRRDGANFPPARVYQLADGRLMLAEGHHRRWAMLGAGDSDMLCEVVDGTMEDAIVHAAGSNKGPGLQAMGPKDVTRAIEMLLEIDEWWMRSSKVISDHVGCKSTRKVDVVRRAVSARTGKPIPQKLIGCDGIEKTRTLGKSSMKRSISRNTGGYKATYKSKQIYGKTKEIVQAKLDEMMDRDPPEQNKGRNPRIVCSKCLNNVSLSDEQVASLREYFKSNPEG